MRVGVELEQSARDRFLFIAHVPSNRRFYPPETRFEGLPPRKGFPKQKGCQGTKVQNLFELPMIPWQVERLIENVAKRYQVGIFTETAHHSRAHSTAARRRSKHIFCRCYSTYPSKPSMQLRIPPYPARIRPYGPRSGSE